MAVGFTLRVNGQGNRQIPTSDVAVIDFTGNPGDGLRLELRSVRGAAGRRPGATGRRSTAPCTTSAALSPLRIFGSDSCRASGFSRRAKSPASSWRDRPTRSRRSGTSGAKAGGGGFAAPGDAALGPRRASRCAAAQMPDLQHDRPRFSWARTATTPRALRARSQRPVPSGIAAAPRTRGRLDRANRQRTAVRDRQPDRPLRCRQPGRLFLGIQRRQHRRQPGGIPRGDYAQAGQIRK